MNDDLVKRLRVCAAFDPDQAEAADRIEKLEAANLQQSLIKVDDMQRIEKLEAALWEIAASAWDCNGKTCDHCRPNNCENAFIARKALEGKDD